MWKDIQGYEGLYQVSSDGKVKSLKGRKERILKISRKNKYYSQIKFYYDGIKKGYTIHRVVANAFIPNPDNLPCVCHTREDLDKNGFIYNGVENLYWGTYKDNIIDCHKKLRANNHLQLKNPNKGKFGKYNPLSKKVGQYTKDGTLINVYFGQAEASRATGIDHTYISSCCIGKQKTSGGYIWKFL